MNITYSQSVYLEINLLDKTGKQTEYTKRIEISSYVPIEEINKWKWTNSRVDSELKEHVLSYIKNRCSDEFHDFTKNKIETLIQMFGVENIHWALEAN